MDAREEAQGDDHSRRSEIGDFELEKGVIMSQFHLIAGEEPEVSLCRFVVETTYRDLPDYIVDHCKRSILDTMAVTVGGSGMEAIPELVEIIKDKGGKPESYLPFYGGKVPASEAGLAIGPMSRAMDFGDVHDEASHASEYVLAALLAASGLKEKVSGKEFITSFALGKEVLVRIGIAFRALSGSFPTGLGDGHFIFGSVTAVGSLLGLNLEEMKDAMGVVRSMAQPLDVEIYRSGTLMTRLHHGFVTQDAINACLLAKKGIKAYHKNILTGPTGYFGTARWQTYPEDLTRDLGMKWEMVDAAMKPYSACKCTHASIQALQEVMRENQLTADEIEEVTFDESSINFLTVCIPPEVKWNPQTVPECQFSLPYVVATGALGYEVLPSAYTPEAKARADVREFMKRVSAREDPGLPIYTARAHVTLKDARRFSKECLYIKGHPKNPFTVEELISKFRQCVPYSAYKLSETTVKSMLDSILSLEKVGDVVEALIVPLTPM
jgi:2-methylcitrate dehydratase PrpD